MSQQFIKEELIIFDKHMKVHSASVLIRKLHIIKYYFEPIKLTKSLKVDSI